MSEETAKGRAKRQLAPKKLTVRKTAPRPPVKEGHKRGPQALKLLITVVDRKKTEYFADLIQSFDVNMQFYALARGTATSEVLHMMGLEESEKRVIFSLVRADMAGKVLKTLEEKFHTIKNGKGIAMTVPLTGVIGVSIYQFLCNNRKGLEREEMA